MPRKLHIDYNDDAARKANVKRGWPVYWPQLGPINIRKNSYFGIFSPDRNCACLLGWVHNMVNTEDPYDHKPDTKIFTKIVKVINDTVRDMYPKVYERTCLTEDEEVYRVADLNDGSLSTSQIAKVWNLVGEKLGYTE